MYVGVVDTSTSYSDGLAKDTSVVMGVDWGKAPDSVTVVVLTKDRVNRSLYSHKSATRWDRIGSDKPFQCPLLRANETLYFSVVKGGTPQPPTRWERLIDGS